MRSGLRYALGGTIGAAAFLVFVAALELPLAAMPASGNANPASFVDRTAKSDRLSAPAVSMPTRAATQPELPHGCLAAREWHKDIFSAEVAGRCVV